MKEKKKEKIKKMSGNKKKIDEIRKKKEGKN